MPTSGTSKDELRRRVYEAIDRRAEEIVGLGERIASHAEMGFKEVKTARLVRETLQGLGLEARAGLAMTGVRADARGRGGEGPTFALIGELDGLRVTGHPKADPETGAAHACGHNAQVAGMLGAAMGLLDAKAFDHLAGCIVFFAVPAEEGGDIEWRQGQIQAGALEFPCGKQELIRLGHFDDVDLAMMIHTNWRREDGKAGVPASNNGRVGKTARFIGRASHAGGAPHLGINALYAAQVALAGINAVRETFRDEDSIRVHPILTHGGSQVNVIPGEARLEMYVRGKSAEGVADASARVDRALRAGALALGAQVEIETLPGPMPLLCDPTMAKLFETTARELVGDEHYRNIPHRSGLHGHGRPEPDHAHPAPLHGRGHRRGAFRGVQDRGQAARIHPARQGAGLHGHRPARRRRHRGARSHQDGQTPDDARRLSRLPARYRPPRTFRRRHLTR